MSASTDCADVPASITSRHITSYGRRAKLLLLLLLLRLSNQLPRRIQADQPTHTHTHAIRTAALYRHLQTRPFSSVSAVDAAAAAARPGPGRHTCMPFQRERVHCSSRTTWKGSRTGSHFLPICVRRTRSSPPLRCSGQYCGHSSVCLIDTAPRHIASASAAAAAAAELYYV